MDDFERKINIGSKEKYCEIFNRNYLENVFNGYPCKNVAKYFCIFFGFRIFKLFFI